MRFEFWSRKGLAIQEPTERQESTGSFFRHLSSIFEQEWKGKGGLGDGKEESNRSQKRKKKKVIGERERGRTFPYLGDSILSHWPRKGDMQVQSIPDKNCRGNRRGERRGKKAPLEKKMKRKTASASNSSPQTVKKDLVCESLPRKREIKKRVRERTPCAPRAGKGSLPRMGDEGSGLVELGGTSKEKGRAGGDGFLLKLLA